jgi:hypothetical protein
MWARSTRRVETLAHVLWTLARSPYIGRPRLLEKGYGPVHAVPHPLRGFVNHAPARHRR